MKMFMIWNTHLQNSFLKILILNNRPSKKKLKPII